MTPDAATVGWVAVAPLAELRRRKRKQVEVAGRAIALFLVGDRVFALDDTCVHKGRSLSRGTVWKGKVVCPGHQWTFDPETGRADDQDGCQPVHDVLVVDGIVHVHPHPRSDQPEERT
jgi:nitrite reductase/ring-hydroxylating ferredoxin subunit